MIDKSATFDFWINETDFIILGLVLNLTNINELEDREFDDRLWKTTKIGYSVLSIIFFASILALVTYTDFKKIPDIDKGTLKLCSFSMAVVSFLFSYSIYNRLNAIDK